MVLKTNPLVSGEIIKRCNEACRKDRLQRSPGCHYVIRTCQHCGEDRLFPVPAEKLKNEEDAND